MAKNKKKDASLGRHAASKEATQEEIAATETMSQSTKTQANDEGKPEKEAPSQKATAKTEETDFEDQFSSPQGAVGESAFVAAYQGKPRKSKKNLKRVGIVFASLLGLTLVLYLAGCVYFNDHFYPRTVMGDYDLSLKSSSEAEPLLVEAAADYEIKVQGEGLTFSFLAEDAGVSIDEAAVIRSALDASGAWMWPLEISKEHDVSEHLVARYEKSVVTQEIQALVDTYNSSATQPVNATIAFDEATGSFQVVPDIPGTALEAVAVIRLVDKAIVSLSPDAKITSAELVQPLVSEETSGLRKACDSANAMIKTDLTLNVGGFEVAALDPSTISDWIRLGDDFDAVFDEEAFNAWTETVIKGCNTVGTARTYTRPDGKVITVEGGSYGWEVDGDALRNLIREGVSSGKVGVIEIPVLQTGTGFVGIGGQDWGKRYCDIDLSEQYARFYDASGSLVWESPIISGKPDGKHGTPTGVYYINMKESPSKLIGEVDPKTKKPEYETVVTYWMPFVGNAVGLHDATWQPSFGGTMYADGYGSHGCINLPYPAAQSLYDIILPDDTVVCHW